MLGVLRDLIETAVATGDRNKALSQDTVTEKKKQQQKTLKITVCLCD